MRETPSPWGLCEVGVVKEPHNAPAAKFWVPGVLSNGQVVGFSVRRGAAPPHRVEGSTGRSSGPQVAGGMEPGRFSQQMTAPIGQHDCQRLFKKVCIPLQDKGGSQ